MRAAGLMWTALIILIGVSLFVLKYQVQALEDELHAKERQVAHDRSAIRVLEAEWAYLNDPDRLRRLSGEYLGLGPAATSNIARMRDLPFKDHLTPPAENEMDVVPSLRDTPVAVDTARDIVPAARQLSRNSDPNEDAGSASALPNASAAASSAAWPDPRRPSVLSASIARLQRIFTPVGPGATITAEPPR